MALLALLSLHSLSTLPSTLPSTLHPLVLPAPLLVSHSLAPTPSHPAAFTRSIPLPSRHSAIGKRRRCHIKACDKPPPKRGADAVDAASKLREQLGDDDPIFQDELFLSSQQLRYADGRTGGGVGYLASYLPFTAANNHSRAVVCVVTQSDSFSEVALRTLVDRVALSCECVALLPFLRGGAASWPHERLVNEVLDASRYLNRAHRVERLAVLAYGAGSQKTLELLADGGIEAHAAVLLCPGLSAGASRAARVIQTPLLAICTSDAEKEELLQGLRVNSRIARDYFIADFVGREPDFASAPASAPQEEAQRVLALIQSWVDRYVPEVPS